MSWHVQTTITSAIAAVLGLFTLIGWWIRRRIGIVDALERRVSTVEENKVSYESLNSRIEKVEGQVRSGHKEIREDLRDMRGTMNQILRCMPKRDHDGQ